MKMKNFFTNWRAPEPWHRNPADTELEAGKKIQPKIKGLQFQVLARLRTAGDHGWIGTDLAEDMHRLVYSVKPRLTELRKAGLIQDSGKRRKNKTGGSEMVFTITELGRETLKQVEERDDG